MEWGGIMDFWESLDKIVLTHKLVIDRPKGSRHPRFQESIYPLDYGYLEGTVSSDGDGVDVWLGSIDDLFVQAIIMTVDPVKGELEPKIITGCTDEEIETIMNYHATFKQNPILVKRTA